MDHTKWNIPFRHIYRNEMEHIQWYFIIEFIKIVPKEYNFCIQLTFNFILFYGIKLYIESHTCIVYEYGGYGG